MAFAGPPWAAVSLAQALTRDGFDLTRHPLSAPGNGPAGWLQIANFLDELSSMSWHSYGHLAAGTITFAALIAGRYVLGSHFAGAGHRRHAVASRIAGTVLLAGDLWAMSGGRAGSLTLAAGANIAMVWVSAVAAPSPAVRAAQPGWPKRRRGVASHGL